MLLDLTRQRKRVWGRLPFGRKDCPTSLLLHDSPSRPTIHVPQNCPILQHRPVEGKGTPPGAFRRRVKRKRYVDKNRRRLFFGRIWEGTKHLINPGVFRGDP